MTWMPRLRTPAPGLVLALMITTGAACSSNSGTRSTAAPTSAAPGTSAAARSGTSTGAGSGTSAGAGSGTSAAAGSGSSTTTGARSCRSTTTATGSNGGGDILVPGDIPDTQHFVTYHSSDGYHVDYPEGWAQMQSGTTVSFTDKFNSIVVEVTAAPTPPSMASAQSHDVAALAAATSCFQAGQVSQVTRKAGPAVLITYRADSPPDSVTGKVVLRDVERYQFWQSGKLIALTLSSPKGSDNVDPWRKVTDSFTWGQ